MIDAVKDGGRNSRDFVEAEARSSDELETTFLCYAALAAWQKEGFDLIVNIALAGHTVKSKSGALTVLASLAADGQMPKPTGYMIPDPLLNCVNAKLNAPSTRIEARQSLRSLVMSLPVDELLIPISQSFFHFALAANEPAEELVSSLAAKWIRFGPAILDQFEDMLVTSATDEPAFQSFFCDFPQLLDPMAVQVWSEPNFHGAFKPDFVIRRADDSYLVIEIECPSKLLITQNHRLSQAATHAETQTLEYEDFLSERVAEARIHFPKYRRADCLTVIGLERTLSDKQRTALERSNGRKQNSKVVGFDWLLQRAKSVVGNVGEPKIQVIKGHRLI